MKDMMVCAIRMVVILPHIVLETKIITEKGRISKVNGQIIENSKPSFDEISQYDSLTDDFCMDAKNLFGDYDDHSNKGGLKKMGDSMKNGMVLVLSLWDDHAAHMLWL